MDNNVYDIAEIIRPEIKEVTSWFGFGPNVNKIKYKIWYVITKNGRLIDDFILFENPIMAKEYIKDIKNL